MFKKYARYAVFLSAAVILAGSTTAMAKDRGRDNGDEREHEGRFSFGVTASASVQAKYKLCLTNARTALKSASEKAKQDYKTAIKAAKDKKSADVTAANGDKALIKAARKAYKDATKAAKQTHKDAIKSANNTYKSAVKTCRDQRNATPTPTPTVSVTPTPTPSTPTPTPATPTPTPATPTPTPTQATPTPTPTPVSFSMSVVATHSSSSSCWTAINGKVYNLTPWISQHPGGQAAILGLCGINGTAAFNAMHNGQANPAAELATFFIGLLQ